MVSRLWFISFEKGPGMRKRTDHVTMYKACEELWEVIYSEHIPDQGAVKLRLRLVRGYRSWVEMARVV